MNLTKGLKYVEGAATIIIGLIGIISGTKKLKEGSDSDKVVNAEEVTATETETEVIETQGEVVEPEETTEE